jgi:hypothetical protein
LGLGLGFVDERGATVGLDANPNPYPLPLALALALPITKAPPLGLMPASSIQRSTRKALSTASALPHARMRVVYGVTEAWPTS